jgi:choline dehydrogenase-like flavoprotein
VLVDARELPHDTELAVDVCIIGAGAAGITLARALSRPTATVAVLESGFTTPHPPTQALAGGTSVGLPYFPLDDERTRTRGFGGSTSQWAGECRPLDRIDFEAREWIPDSGWPFALDALLPWYHRAQDVCRLGPFAYTAEEWAVRSRPPAPRHDDRTVPFVIQYSPPTRFGEAYRDELARAPSTTVYLGANVVAIVPTDADRAIGTQVRHVVVATLAGNRFTVSARHFVLAAGGIENARILLVADRAHPGALGNARDLVGRHFMEHLYLDTAAVLDVARPFARAYARDQVVDGRRIRLGLQLSSAEQRRARVAGFGAVLGWPGAAGAVRRTARLRQRVGSLRSGRTRIELKNVVEQVPNPASRVVLGEAKDALGVPRVVLDWRTSELDVHTARHAHRTIDAVLRAADLGAVVSSRAVDRAGGHEAAGWPEGLRGGRHHMGTTRMHRDPGRGVVDGDCRVHGVANLFVAGSSVFPTVGTANPTLTIVALALRLAQRITDELERGRHGGRLGTEVPTAPAPE